MIIVIIIITFYYLNNVEKEKLAQRTPKVLENKRIHNAKRDNCRPGIRTGEFKLQCPEYKVYFLLFVLEIEFLLLLLVLEGC